MNGITGTISDTVKHLGQAFVLAYYLPAMVFVLVHTHVLLPAWPDASLSSPEPTPVSTSAVDSTSPEPTPVPTGAVDSASPEATPVPTGAVDLASPEPTPAPIWREIFAIDLASTISTTVGTLLVPLLVGIILVGLNSTLIRAFEGRLPWLREGLFRPLTQRNRKRCERLYGRLIELRRKSLEVKRDLGQATSEEDQRRFMQLLEGLREQIQEEHKKIEQEEPLQTLPHDVHRVAPTAFGNAYAMAEEYPYERYGADAVLFWTRLRELMHEKATSHSERLTQQKTALDLSLNFAFLSGLLALEAFVLLFVNYSTLLLLLGVIGVILFISFYNASVGAVRVMGELIKNSFDYHRGLILESFNLKAPADLSTEQVVWVRLAAFIQRGDDFYFPTEHRKTEDKDEGASEAVKT